MKLKKYEGNPILSPIKEHDWEAKMVFNPAIYSKDGVHIVYRAMDEKGVSRLGYAFSKDGYAIDERLSKPIFEPETEFESNGVEDPRITKIGDILYMVYTGFDGKQANVALATIKEDDFLNREWKWERHGDIFPRKLPFRGKDDKDAFLFPEKINGKWLLVHRVPPDIWYSYSPDLVNWTDHASVLKPRPGSWDSVKIGGGCPPIKTDNGWVFIYHGVSPRGKNFFGVYRLGIYATSLTNPEEIIYRSKKPILEPKERYELARVRGGPDVVFSCGHAILGDKVLVYYGGGDVAIGVAEAKLKDFEKEIQKRKFRRKSRKRR
jgi:predicted GH43/DUF377 family glycosyl hydrolase